MALFAELLDIDRTPNPLPALVPPTWPDYRMPTVHNLRRVGSLETYRELTAGQFRDRLNQARLQAFCMGRVPTERGMPKTSKATCDEDVVTL